MITLSKKLREEKNKSRDKGSRLRSVRDILLTKGKVFDLKLNSFAQQLTKLSCSR